MERSALTGRPVEQERNLDKTLLIALSALAHDCASAGKSYRQLIELAGQLLDESGLEGAERQKAFDFAVTAAGALGVANDAVLSTGIRKMGAILREAAMQAISADWHRAVMTSWPAPIAHELARLLDVMMADTPNVSTADTALGQLRDCYEILIKFTAIALMQALVDAGDDDGRWSKESLYSQMSLGDWAGLLRAASTKVGASDSLDETLRRLAVATLKHLVPGADAFKEVRNNTIGHGSRSLDTKETAELVRACVLGGDIPSARGERKRIAGLFSIFEKMEAAKAYGDIALILEVDSATIALDGTETVSDWLNGAHHQTHDFVSQGHSILLRISDERRLVLSPLVAARVCRKCGRQDISIYDSLNSPRKGGVFDLMDYARGHKSRYLANEAEDLAVFFSNMPTRAPTSVVEGKDRTDQRVIEALDRARIDRNYLSPAFMRDAFAEFLKTQSKGAFWLQAPAHVGKTTFVQGLASRDILKEKAILPRFEREDGGYIIAYYIRREIRAGIPDFMNTIERQFFAQFTSDTTRNMAPKLPDDWERHHGPGPFADWLASWRKFALDFGRLEVDAPFILAIDGLDEAEDPAKAGPRGSVISLLPDESMLPDGIFLLLTSRLPNGTDEVPAFLSEMIVPLYPVHG